jgi:dienelactone hydrolase
MSLLGLAAVTALVANGCSGGGGAHAGRVQLTATPQEAVFDVPVGIALTGVKAHAPVTLRVTSVDAHHLTFSAQARFVADSHGRVDPAAMAPSGGDYFGVVSMGLFTAMRPSEGQPTLYFWGRDPQSFTITATSGTTVLAQTTVMRRGFDPGVHSTMHPVSETGFLGQYWQPAQTNSHAAILQIGGYAGLGGQLAGALFATHGYRTLTIAYFGAAGLPSTLSNIPLEYFANALRWLGKQPGIDPHQLFVSGVSRGSEAALLLAADFPDLVRGVIASVPMNVALCSLACDGPEWTLNGAPVPYTRQLNNPAPSDEPDAVIHVEHINGPLFLDCGGADRIWRSCAYADAIVRRLIAFNPQGTHILAAYPDGGDGVGTLTPFEPGTDPVEAVTGSMGSTEQANTLARAQLWPRLLAFLDKATARPK